MEVVEKKTDIYYSFLYLIVQKRASGLRFSTEDEEEEDDDDDDDDDDNFFWPCSFSLASSSLSLCSEPSSLQIRV